MVALLEERYLLVLMRRSGLTASEIAARAGIDESTISRIKTGAVQNPRPDSWRAIVEAAGGTIEEWNAFVDCRLVNSIDATHEEPHPVPYVELVDRFNNLINRQTEHYEKENAEYRRFMDERDKRGLDALHRLRTQRNIFMCSTFALTLIVVCLLIIDLITRRLS